MTSGLEPMLCFDLYVASRAMTAAYRPLLAEHELTYPQYLLLVTLWDRDDVTIKQLAATVRLDHGTLTPLLRRLEERGLLRRERGHDDARSVRVSLTERGRALSSIQEQVHCAIAETVGLDPAEMDALQETLHRLTDRLTDRLTGPVSPAPAR